MNKSDGILFGKVSGNDIGFIFGMERSNINFAAFISLSSRAKSISWWIIRWTASVLLTKLLFNNHLPI